MCSDSSPHLKDRLLDLAEDEVERIGHERLSLRALAAAAKVAPSAPYRHFADRAALLQALAERGFERLLKSHGAAATLAGSPVERLACAIWGFIGFARAHPALFRLMFASDALRGEPGEGPASQSFAIFEAIVAEACGYSGKEVRVHSLALWSAMHGVAQLELDNRFKNFNRTGIDTDAVVAAIIARFT